MALQVLMVVDGNGDSQIVALCVINSENIATMTAMLTIFCTNNPNHNRTITIMVDKNAANLASFKAVFPHAGIHICIFHVIQIFQHEITAQKLNITEQTRKEALNILIEMIHCRTERQYRDLYTELTSLNSEKLTEYFCANWHRGETRQMWVGYFVNQVSHYNNRTNNRIESFNQKLKAIICSYAPLKHFFRDLSILVTSMSMEKTTKAISTSQKIPTRYLNESPLAQGTVKSQL